MYRFSIYVPKAYQSLHTTNNKCYEWIPLYTGNKLVGYILGLEFVIFRLRIDLAPEICRGGEKGIQSISTFSHISARSIHCSVHSPTHCNSCRYTIGYTVYKIDAGWKQTAMGMLRYITLDVAIVQLQDGSVCIVSCHCTTAGWHVRRV